MDLQVAKIRVCGKDFVLLPSGDICQKRRIIVVNIIVVNEYAMFVKNEELL